MPRKPNGSNTRKASIQRQNDKANGGTVPTMALPTMALPAQNNGGSINRTMGECRRVRIRRIVYGDAIWSCRVRREEDTSIRTTRESVMRTTTESQVTQGT